MNNKTTNFRDVRTTAMASTAVGVQVISSLPAFLEAQPNQPFLKVPSATVVGGVLSTGNVIGRDWKRDNNMRCGNGNITAAQLKSSALLSAHSR